MPGFHSFGACTGKVDIADCRVPIIVAGVIAAARQEDLLKTANFFLVNLVCVLI